jgi:hypothetical protein
MNSTRADILRRRTLGRTLLPSVLDLLHSALGNQAVHVKFVSLEESDSVWPIFETRWKEERLANAVEPRKFFLESMDKPALLRYISEVKDKLPNDVEMYLFLPQWSYCGAVKLPLGKALDAAERLVRTDQEDLLACDRSGSVGVVFESYTFEAEARYKFLAWNRALSAERTSP